jgi:hypothetical protein
MSDTISVEILEDGTISVRTSAVSDTNHMSADALMEQLDTLMGGHVNIIPNEEELTSSQAHQHKHGFAHAH